MISVIVPVFNVEKYLPKCLDSLLAQTCKDMEFILVDDGSPDGCPAICDEYAAKDSRFKVIHQKNAGVSAARNAGLNFALGEYIGFIDPDDWISENMYAEMLAVMKNNSSDMAICGYEYYGEDGSRDENRLYSEHENEVIDQKEVMRRFADMPPTLRHGVVNKLFKASMIQDLRFDEKLHSSEDVMFVNSYVSSINAAVVVHKPFYKNLVRNCSATHGGLSIDNLADSFVAHKAMYETSVTAYPDLKNHCLAFLIDACMLKYCEAKRCIDGMSEQQKQHASARLREMRRFIKSKAFAALFDREIFWKTRIMYLVF